MEQPQTTVADGASAEQREAERRAREPVLLRMLDVVDGLERALAALNDDSSVGAVREGVGLVLRSLMRDLEAYGVRPVGAIGEQFDPSVHDAVAREPSHDREPGTVLNEVQRGYTIQNRLLRPAAVVVAESPIRRRRPRVPEAFVAAGPREGPRK